MENGHSPISFMSEYLDKNALSVSTTTSTVLIASEDKLSAPTVPVLRRGTVATSWPLQP
uniref:Uncharacterized protein n=1 Tax=Hyaloperonospora arabidopsidis (strain Emoy2) TaxID=559515 RepID=M4BWG1_HYAAE